MESKRVRVMLKKIKISLAAMALCGASLVAGAADEFSIQLKWVTQAQFAGYYVALKKGYYSKEGLDVTIVPGGPDISPVQVIAGGGADVVVEWMPAALAAREKGLDLVNVAQFFDQAGMMLTCRKETGIVNPKRDFPGRKLGVWFFGNEYPFLSWMSKLNIPIDGSEGGVTVLKQGFNVDPLLQGQADCISTMIYNEFWQIIDAGIDAGDLIVFRYEDQGVSTLEDGLYALRGQLNDPEYVDKLTRFVRASVKGWEWARNNPDKAADIVLEYDETGAQTQKHQRRMMGEIAKLLGPKGKLGMLDPADFKRTVQVLLSGENPSVITRDPGGEAWTHKITDSI